MNKKIMIENYPHERAMHCETGSARNLFKFCGKEYSESMIFGIGSGIDFIHFPIPLLNNLECPLFRSLTTQVFKNFSKQMKIKYKMLTFHDQNKQGENLTHFWRPGFLWAWLWKCCFSPTFVKYQEIGILMVIKLWLSGKREMTISLVIQNGICPPHYIIKFPLLT
jgi:hypothetical protein